MNYQAAIDYLYSIPMFTKVGADAYKPGFERISDLCSLLDHPHKCYRTIHVAGTNGKGSSSSMIASILMAAGYSVGLYSSPHLFDFRERIKVNGQMIEREQVVEYVELMRPTVERSSASFFEVVTAMAFDYFRKKEVDFAVIETGLGGALDATNVISPIATLITNIGYDHTAILGNTLPEIALQKAGIIKEGTPLVIGEYCSDSTPVFEAKAKELNAPYLIASNRYREIEQDGGIFWYDHNGSRVYAECDQRGGYQSKNIASVMTLFDLLDIRGVISIGRDVIAEGLRSSIERCGLQGRWQKLSVSPQIICDTGHNSHGLKHIFKQLMTESKGKFIAIIGFASDKDLSSIFDIFPTSGSYIFTQGENPRLMDCKILQEKAASLGLNAIAIEKMDRAIDRAKEMAQDGEVIFIGGSNFVVAEIGVDLFKQQ